MFGCGRDSLDTPAREAADLVASCAVRAGATSARQISIPFAALLHGHHAELPTQASGA